MLGLSILKMPDDELFGVFSILLIYYLLRKFQILGIKKFKLMKANNYLQVINDNSINKVKKLK